MAGLLAAVIQSDPSVIGTFQAAVAGTGYGLFSGWIFVLGMLGGIRSR